MGEGWGQWDLGHDPDDEVHHTHIRKEIKNDKVSESEVRETSEGGKKQGGKRTRSAPQYPKSSSRGTTSLLACHGCTGPTHQGHIMNFFE